MSEGRAVDTPRIVTVGDNVVDCYPELGHMYPGGNAVNVAVNIARLGEASSYVGAVGTDDAGTLIKSSLVAEGVDCSRLRVVEGANALAWVRVVEGNRVFTGAELGVSRFEFTVDDLGWIAGAGIVHTGDCSGFESQLPTLRALPPLLSFDFSNQPWSYVEQVAPLVDIAVLSIEGSPELGPEVLAREVASCGPKYVAVTRGADGAFVLTPSGTASASAPRISTVDTLGAGDAFIARFLIGIARAETPAQIAEAATTYASGTCLFYGAFGYQAPMSGTDDHTPGTLQQVARGVTTE